MREVVMTVKVAGFSCPEITLGKSCKWFFDF